MYSRRRYRRGYRRHFLRHRKWRRPRRIWRRHWRRYRRPRVRSVTQVQPRKKKTIVVTGWEILGTIGSQIQYRYDEGTKSGHIDIQNIAPTNKQVDYLAHLIPQRLNNQCSDTWGQGTPRTAQPAKEPNYWNFVGGWGYAKFDFQSLVLRNLLGFNRFSDSFVGYTHIRIIKFRLDLVRGYSVDYLYRLQMHRGPQDREDPLMHPANLLNMPFVTWVESVKRSKCCRHKIIRRRPGIDYTGWYDIETFRNYELFSYMWTAFDPNNPMGKNPRVDSRTEWWDQSWITSKGKDTKIRENMNVTWFDRNWDNTFVKNVNNIMTPEDSIWDFIWPQQKPENFKGKHTPFLPPVINTEVINTLWFRYKIWFQVGGGSISRISPWWPIRETVDTTNPKNGCPPNCPYCIHKGDTDEQGILTEHALERITGDAEHRQRDLVEKLARIIRQSRKRKRVTWEDEKEETASPTHTNPKKGKIKCLRYLASRIGLRLVRK
uniref:Capsid protein n=1 Tax=Giant panda anellovirus TaxID=2016460 RepID=A0A220IGI3_9VIRU|nr:ORF1 [Giant panda anellovirus]